jgi:hypothetical protein
MMPASWAAYSARLRQRLETSIQECLGRASRPIVAFGPRRNRPSHRREQVRERRIDTVPNESSHTGGVIAFPQWIGGQSDVCRPARNGAGWKNDRVADGFVPAATPIEHSRQHRHVQVGVIVDPYLTLAVMEAMQPPDVLRNRPSP